MQLDDEREHADVEGRDLAPPKTVNVAAPVPFGARLGEARREGVGIRRERANFRDELHEPGVQAAPAAVAENAERLLAGPGWLPAVLRIGEASATAQ